MLLRHTTIYAFGRLAPSLLSLFGIAIFTRLLGAEQYGIYVTGLAIGSLWSIIGVSWLRAGALRYAGSQSQPTLVKTIWVIFLLFALLSVLLALPFTFLFSPLLVLGVIWSSVTSSFFELTMDIQRSNLNPAAVSLGGLIRAILFLTIGVLVVSQDGGPEGLLLSTGAAAGFAALPFFRGYESAHAVGRKTFVSGLQEILRYGLPLTFTLSASHIMRTADRLMLALLAGPAAAGIYAAAYDLSRNTLEAIMSVVSNAGFSLAVRRYEQQGVPGAQKQLSENVRLLLFLSLPAVVGLIIISPALVQTILSIEFHDAAAPIVSLISIGVLISGLRAYFVDHVFQITGRTSIHAFVMGAVALLNIALNLIFIPAFGVSGAAATSIFVYAVALVVSYYVALASFPLIFPARDFLHISLCAIGMGLTVHCVTALIPATGALGLVFSVLTGLSAYAAFALAFNLLGVRMYAGSILAVWRKRDAR